MNPKALELQDRTHRFLLGVIQFCEALPRVMAAARISGQLLDAAGGTDSNYRGACRGRSHKEFIAKLGVAAEEADEARGWLLALRDAGMGDRGHADLLITEADELTRIFVASQKTARRNAAKHNGARRNRSERR